MKENGNQTDPNGGYSSGWNARRSLNLLKFSLNRPMMLPYVDEDGDEEMEIVEESDQLDIQSAGREARNDVALINQIAEGLNSDRVACGDGTVGSLCQIHLKVYLLKQRL